MPTFYNGSWLNVSNNTTATIIGATNTTPIVIQTSAPHLFADKDLVVITGVLGITNANTPQPPFGFYQILLVDATHFALYQADGVTAVAGSGAYVSGGVAKDISLLPPFQIPSDGDPFNAAAFNVAFEALADRTQNLQLQAFETSNDLVNGIDGESAAVGIQNWYPNQFKQVNNTGTAFDLSAKRNDGTATMFWSNFFHLWIALGSATAGGWYVGADPTLWLLNASGGTYVYTFGCACADRIVLFSGSAYETGYSNAGSYTSLEQETTLPFVGSANPNYQNDCVYDSVNDIVIVVGGNGGEHSSWTSTDHGVTFTAHHGIGAASAPGGPFLNRIILGGNNLLCVSWLTDTTANNGNRIYYSIDHGTTFSHITTSFDNIVCGAYSIQSGRYLFITTSGVMYLSATNLITDNVWTTQNPAFAAGGATIKDVAVVGSFFVVALLTATSLPSVWYTKTPWDDTSWKFGFAFTDPTETLAVDTTNGQIGGHLAATLQMGFRCYPLTISS